MEATNTDAKDVRFVVLSMCITLTLIALIVRLPQILEVVKGW